MGALPAGLVTARFDCASKFKGVSGLVELPKTQNPKP